MAILGSSGQPADGIGADGDFVFDYKNRIFFGPKGVVTAGSWSGTANSVQGPAGLGVLSGSGNPSSNIGQQGNSYVDVATGNLWFRATSGWTQGGSIVTQFSPILQGAGPPNSSTAPTVQVGQMYFDQQNSLLYGPSTSASAAGLTQVTNVVGPTGAAGAAGATGASTAYRNIARASYFSNGAPTAGTTYNMLQTVTASSSATYGVPFTETMYASGSLYALTASSPAGVGSSVWSFNILKNGVSVYRAASFLTLGSAVATPYKVLPTGLNFAAGDVITMTGSPSTSNSNQSFNINLAYTTNS